MSQLETLFQIVEGMDMPSKTGFLGSFFTNANFKKLKNADLDFLSNFAFIELDRLNREIPRGKNYAEKCVMFDYMDTLFGLLIKIYPTRDAIPSDKAIIANESMCIMKRERFLEELIEHLFSLDVIGKYDVERLLDTLAQITDETHKGQLYGGILHFKGNLGKLASDAKAMLGGYIADEIERYLGIGDGLSEEQSQNLEIACDVCRYFISDRIVGLLERTVGLGSSNISFYAVQTLIIAEREPAIEVVEALAHDIVYADVTYHMLRQYGKEGLFPTSLADPIYLAKSDLVRWLTYPTELGEQPRQIEYVGDVVSKREVFHVFKFMSDSDKLPDDLKDKWLVGWSSEEGGTFSHFHEYSALEKKTPEKTLKNIRKKEIG